MPTIALPLEARKAPTAAKGRLCANMLMLFRQFFKPRRENLVSSAPSLEDPRAACSTSASVGGIAALTTPAVCCHARAMGAALMLKAIGFMRMLSGVAVVSSIVFGGVPARAGVLEQTKKVAGVTVHYKVVLPEGYDATKTYPGDHRTIGGGQQTMNTVDGILARNFRAEAEKRGYIVVALAAPDGQLFFEGGARIFPDFLKMILADYKIQDGKFHIAGPSNGGIAAFHVAAANPQYLRSVTAFPGYMWEPTPAKLQAISKMCVFMYVGENDEYRWHDEMKSEVDFLRAKGTVARYTVEKGQPHRLDTLAGANAARLFDGFEETKKGCAR